MMTWFGYAGALSLILAGASVNRPEEPAAGPSAADAVAAPSAPLAVVHGGDNPHMPIPNEGGGGCGAPQPAPGGCGAPAPDPAAGGCGGH
jgi:hypothetical protein